MQGELAWGRGELVFERGELSSWQAEAGDELGCIAGEGGEVLVRWVDEVNEAEGFIHFVVAEEYLSLR
jgi:hypothetical protein